MRYFIDYENVNVRGLLGIEDLTEEDSVVVLYSNKVCSISMDFIEIFQKCKCKIELKKMEKTAPNYLDFHLVCEVSTYLFTQMQASAIESIRKDSNMSNMKYEYVGIVSEDKGYISARDFFAKFYERDVIFLDKDIQSIRKMVLKEDLTKTTSAENKDKEEVIKAPEVVVSKEVVETKEQQPVEEIKPPKHKKEEEKENPSPYIKSGGVVTDSVREQIKSVLKGMPKQNGKMHEIVYEEFEKCKTLGEFRFAIVNRLGTQEGKRVLSRVEPIFCDCLNKGIKKNLKNKK